MSESADPILPGVNEPEPWDRGAAPPEVPFSIQEAAIEELLSGDVGPWPLPATPASPDLLAELPASPPALPPLTEDPTPANSEADAYVNEFKPTDEEWENVKELEFPHPQALPLEVDPQSLYKPEILERDAQGVDGGGDWTEVELDKPKE